MPTLIALLRQSADRAFSHYTMMQRLGRETINDFRKALAVEEERQAKGWFDGFAYRAGSLYSKRLSRFYDRFDASQIKVFLYDDLVDKALGVSQSIYRFLEVDDTFTPDISKRLNEGGTRPVHASLFNAMRKSRLAALMRRHANPSISHYQPLKRMVKAALVKPAVLDPDLRDELTQGYREEIQRLQDMIGRDLSQWLVPTPRRG